MRFGSQAGSTDISMPMYARSRKPQHGRALRELLRRRRSGGKRERKRERVSERGGGRGGGGGELRRFSNFSRFSRIGHVRRQKAQKALVALHPLLPCIQNRNRKAQNRRPPTKPSVASALVGDGSCRFVTPSLEQACRHPTGSCGPSLSSQSLPSLYCLPAKLPTYCACVGRFAMKLKFKGSPFSGCP